MIARVCADEGTGSSVVYLPGIDGSGDLLLGTAETLASSFRLLRLRYADEGGEASYPALATSVAQVVRERNAAPALLLAESFGGGVALRLALDHPRVASSAMLVNSFVRYSKRGSLAVGRALAAVIPRVVFEVLRRAFGPLVLFGGRREADAVARFRSLRLSGFDRAYRARLGMIAGLDLRGELRRLTLPVDMVVGTWDVVVDSVRQARYMTSQLADARVELVPRGGHLILPLQQLEWRRRLAELMERRSARAHP